MHWFHRLPNNTKGIIFLMLASLIFSIMALLIKILGQRIHITQILFVRQIGMILMISPAILRNFPGSLRTTRPGLQAARIAFSLVAMLCSFTAIIYMPLADATALFFAKSFFVTIFAVWFLSEVVGVYRWSAVFVGFAGVLIVLQPGTDNFSIFGVLSLIGAAGAGAVMILLRILTRTDSPETIMTYGSLGVGAVMLIPGIYFWQELNRTEYALIALVTVVSFYGQKLNIHAYKNGEASMLASLDYLRLIWATFFGFLFFNQLPGIWTWVGAAIVIASAIFMIYREAIRKQQLASSTHQSEVH